MPVMDFLMELDPAVIQATQVLKATVVSVLAALTQAVATDIVAVHTAAMDIVGILPPHASLGVRVVCVWIGVVDVPITAAHMHPRTVTIVLRTAALAVQVI